MAERPDHVAPFFDGAMHLAASDGRTEVVNPSNGRVLLSIPTGCDADVDRAVASARAAFADGRWWLAAPSGRKKVLHRFAELIARDAVELDRLDAQEMGKPVGLAVFNAASAAERMRFYAEAIDKVLGDVFTSDAKSLVLQRRVPRGVVAAVVPWNFPTFNAVLKIAPALAAGNSVALKPSELASRSALRLAELAVEAGLPPGILNVVPGLGETVGRALGLHRDVNMVAFTGSTQVGKLMLQYAGQSNMKLVMAECGGKSPHVVFDDGVDLDRAGERIARGLLTNQGQICTLGSRLLVERSIESRMLEVITSRLREAVIGDACDLTTTFGPLASAAQCGRVLQYIHGAAAEGAQLAAGGRRMLEASGGFFVEPTVFRNVPPSARIAQEEIFGPVLSVIAFDDEAEAIRIANGTCFGLAAYVWTADLSRGMRVAKAIRSSVVLNAVAPSGEGAGHCASSEPIDESGFGTGSGIGGLESYLRRQLIWFNHA